MTNALKPEQVIDPDSVEARNIYSASRNIEGGKTYIAMLAFEKWKEFVVEEIDDPQNTACKGISIRCRNGKPEASTIRRYLNWLDGLENVEIKKGNQSKHAFEWVDEELNLTYARMDKELLLKGKTKWRGEAMQWALNNICPNAETMYAHFDGKDMSEEERKQYGFLKALDTIRKAIEEISHFPLWKEAIMKIIEENQ